MKVAIFSENWYKIGKKLMILFTIFSNCSWWKSTDLFFKILDFFQKIECFSKVLSILKKVKFYNKYIRNKEVPIPRITRVG